MTTKSMTLPALLTQLKNEGLFAGEVESTLQTVVEPVEAATPWYVKALVGLSAWLAAGLLGIFFGSAGLIDSAESMLVWGAILCVGGVALRWFVDRSIFWGQMAFVMSLTGQGLLIGGVGWWSDSTSTTIRFVLLLELILFLVYLDSLHRFLSLVAFAVALVYQLYEFKTAEAIHLLTLATCLGTILVWQYQLRFQLSRWRAFQTPLGFGLPMILFAICFLPLLPDLFLLDISEYLPVQYWWISSLLLALALLYVAARVFSDLQMSIQSLAGIAVLAAIVLLLIPAYQTPGILAALLVLLLGFWRQNDLLIGLAVVFLLFFLGAYYYSLNLTLLVKSYILMGSGLILLLLYALLTRLFPSGLQE